MRALQATVVALLLLTACVPPPGSPSAAPTTPVLAPSSVKAQTQVLIMLGQESGLAMGSLTARLDEVKGKTATLTLGGQPSPWEGPVSLERGYEVRRGDYVFTVVDCNEDMPGRSARATVTVRRA